VLRMLTLTTFILAGFAIYSPVTGSGATALASEMTIAGVATGAEEVGPVTSPGKARARFVFDDNANTLAYSVTVTGLSPSLVTASHIHRAPAGANGPVVYPIATTGFTQASGTLDLTAEDVADLRAGNFYLNVHSVEHPGGFARLQLVLPAATAPTIAPPSTGSGGLTDESAGGPTDGLLRVFLAALGVAAGAAYFASRGRRRTAS